jgi:TonB family protein
MGRRGRRTGKSVLPAALRDAPLLATCEDLQERRPRLWWGSQAFSLAVHSLAVAAILQTGVIVIDYSMRFGSGYQFGQAVLLASPLFELGQRDAMRGRQRTIPLSALVPEQKLYAPDLRTLRAVAQTPARAAGAEEPEAARAASGPPEAGISLGLPGGGGGALPGGSLPERIGNGPATPFDLVPPSNTRARRPGETQQVRIRMGDAGIPGGGAAEGLRLPASPARIAISAEMTLQSGDAKALESWLRTLVSRLRRASLEMMPDRRDLGAPGLVRLAFQLDPAGRMVRPRISAGSGNPALDRLALAVLDSIPSFQPLPENALPEAATVFVVVRYFPAR